MTRQRLVLLTLTLVGMLVLAGCSGGDDVAAPVEPPAEVVTELAPEPAPVPVPETPTPQPQDPPETDRAATLAFFFDGERCERTGPDTIDTGRHSASFENRSDGGAFLGTGGLREAFTVEEVLAVASRPAPFNVDDPLPEWLDPARVEFPGLIADPGSEVRGTVNFTPGTYLFSCVFPDPANPASRTGRWVTGGSFVVE